MNVWDAVRTKRAIRRFADRPIAPGDLDRIVRAGTRAHSSKNQQRWAFVIVEDRVRLAQLAASGPYAGHVAGAAVAVALVTPDPAGPGQPLSVVWDVGGAAAQMMLVAWELGIGSCPATVYDQALARELLGYPDELWCEYLLSFGYPADPARLTAPNRSGGRRPIDEVVFRERWQGR
jgi:nitroreductase